MSKRAVVTGGTDGVGKQIALGLLRAGVEVVVVGKDQERGLKTAAEMQSQIPHSRVKFISADLSIMSEVRNLAKTIMSRSEQLHYLVLNAGMVSGNFVLTADGVESNFALNYLSRFVLANALLPLMADSGQADDPARILLISGAAQGGKLDYQNINSAKKFGTLRAVLRFCAANDAFTLELDRRLKQRVPEANVAINSLKLGVVKTDIRKKFPLWMRLLVPLIFDPFITIQPSQAAAAALQLLLDRHYNKVSGELFRLIRKFKKIPADSHARDNVAAQILWDFSDKIAAS